MPRYKLRQMNDWQVKQMPFHPKRVVDPDYPDLSLRITKTVKTWEVREKSDSGKVTWSSFAIAIKPGEKELKTTHKQARKEAARLIALGGARAEKKAAKQQAEAEANERLRVCDVAPLWWQHNVIYRKPKTQNSYRSYLKTLEASPLWTMCLRDIKRRQVKAWQETVRPAPSQANQALLVLKMICKFAWLELECIDRNPVDRHRLLPQPDPDQPIISPEECDILRPVILALPKDKPVKWPALLIIDIGCRGVDACTIEDHEINQAERLWTIPGYKFKNGTAQPYPLSAEQVQFARNAAAWKPKIRSGRDLPLEYLETEAKQNALRYLFRTLRKKLNIPELKGHALRRLMATEIAQDPEFGLIAAQQHLGHKSSKTTEIYLKSSLERRRKISEAILLRRQNRG